MTIIANNSPPPATNPSASALVTPGLRRRMACWVYEGMLMFAVAFMATWLFSTLGQMRNAVDARQHPLLQGFLFVVFGVYFVWFWYKGQTLAMKTWHIRVVDLQGQQISQLRALARYALSWLWFLPPLGVMARFKLSGGEMGLLWAGWVLLYALLSRFHATRQFVHDALAGTRLIHHAPMSK
ncbi:MAG: RDD family protein [Burkholderiaceae bacterium]